MQEYEQDQTQSARSRLLQRLWCTREEGYLRHFAFCWYHRRKFPRPFGQRNVRAALQLLRLKRALNTATPEELARYGISGLVLVMRDTQEGWVLAERRRAERA